MEDQELEQRIAALSPKQRQWFLAYVQDPARNASGAARLAGYGKTPDASSSLGRRLKARYQDLIEAYDFRIKDAGVISPREVQEQLAGIARDPNERTSDRLKSLELIARIHGMLSDKLQVDIDISLAKRELRGFFASPAQGLLVASSSKARPVGQVGPDFGTVAQTQERLLASSVAGSVPATIRKDAIQSSKDALGSAIAEPVDAELLPSEASKG